MEAFVEAIGSDRTIELAPGSFTLSDLDPTWQTTHAHFESVFDGHELIIADVENLTIIGADNTLSRLLTQPRYADVLKFINCRNVKLQNLELAHTKDAGFCRGSVLSFLSCEGVAIEACVLVGSGTHGIEASGLANLNCQASVIKECTYGILCLERAEAIRFEDCQFYENMGFSLIDLANCDQVSFANCLIYDNVTVEQVSDDYVFNVWQSQGIEVTDCTLHDNRVTYLAPAETAIALNNIALEGNSFVPNFLYPTDQTGQSLPLCPI